MLETFHGPAVTDWTPYKSESQRSTALQVLQVLYSPLLPCTTSCVAVRLSSQASQQYQL